MATDCVVPIDEVLHLVNHPHMLQACSNVSHTVPCASGCLAANTSMWFKEPVTKFKPLNKFRLIFAIM